ncbi:MAG: hypothetical protein EA424_13845 [Planctomycetaceae bacterium]|nr:MAG: hypothetical protein EA424_13845 [Planctomycetaceae bacterium]
MSTLPVRDQATHLDLQECSSIFCVPKAPVIDLLAAEIPHIQPHRAAPRRLWDKSLDLALSLNGIPVATAELKNPLTGQTVGHARRQYMTDRDPRDKIFQFKQRALVHFAVDPDQVSMTTRLNGKSTRFLPFNQGDHHGAGNPPSARG